MRLRQIVGLALTAVVLDVDGAGGLHAQAAHQAAEAGVSPGFAGMWRLVSRTQRLADGSTREHPVSTAYLVYVGTQRMCYVGMDPQRPKWVAESAPTPDEAVQGLAGFQAYCATVEIHAREGFVVHHVEIDKAPNLVGRDRKRWFSFDGPDRLRLSIDPSELVPPVARDELVWERVRTEP